ncbi:Glu/Leu/Phe/Val dehydrogenase dimerization domain-containing protein [Brevundimonas sp. LF-1]|uniref:Glu/Leu/Phe/Val dehydrogenase dimerization domain-containing protein n=1 Tax=Brevundimonas sp. LF-1 TaxID=3126100 RepID=UPI0030E481C7
MPNPNILDAALTRLDEAARHVQIDSDVLEKLKYPRETMKVRLLIRMDDGSRKSFLAWRCRYDDTRGPTKGGIRFHPASTAEEVETLAFWMTVKCAVTNLPYGGGKGRCRSIPRACPRPSWSGCRAPMSRPSPASSAPTATFRPPTSTPTP